MNPSTKFRSGNNIDLFVPQFYQIQYCSKIQPKSLHFEVWYNRYSKTCVELPLSNRPQIGFQDQLSLNAGQKYFRMLQGEHSAILLTFIKLPFVI